MMEGGDDMGFEVDCRRFHSILQRSITQFRLKKPIVTNYVIYHLDYIIGNFCYFEDIGMVSEYLCTDNNRFNFAFYRRMKIFIQIIRFNSEDDLRAEEVHGDIQNMVETLTVSPWREGRGGDDGGRQVVYPMTKEEWVRASKEVVFGSVSDSSIFADSPLSRDEDDQGNGKMRQMFRRFESTECPENGEDLGSPAFNPTSKVLKHFFEVLRYHFKVHPHYMIEALDSSFVSAFLGLLNFEPALELFDVLLDMKGLNMQKLAMLLKEARPVSTLIERRYYRGLQMLLLAEWVREDSDSMSSDEEDLFHDEVISAGDRLVSAFLADTSYLEYKQIYDVIEILNYSHWRPKLPVVEFVGVSPRTILYVRLVVGQLDLLMDEIFERNVHHTFIDWFFGHPDLSTLLLPLTVFFSAAIRDPVMFSALVDAGFLDRFHSTCIRYVSVDKGPRPSTESLFSCLVYLYPLLVFYLNKCNREIATSDGWIHLSVVMDPYDRMESLSYCNDEVMEGFLDDCIDESFARYVCQLVVDRMPLPSTFLKEDR